MRTPWSRRLLTAFVTVGGCLVLGGCPVRPAPYPYYEAPPSYYGYPPGYGYPYEEPPYILSVPEGARHENEEREEEEHESPQEERHETPAQERREGREEHEHRG